MPNSPITRQSIRQLTIAWVSAFAIIAFLLTAAQVLIQLTEREAANARAVAGIINLEELRTQFLVRESLILLTPGPHPQELAALRKQYPIWMTTGESIYGRRSASDTIAPSDFTAEEESELETGATSYQQMRDALAQLLALEAGRSPPQAKDVTHEVATIFFAEGPYLNALVNVYMLLDSTATASGADVATIEIILYALTLLVMTFEAFFVVRPALLHLREHFQLLAQLEEKEGQLRDTHKDTAP